MTPQQLAELIGLSLVAHKAGDAELVIMNFTPSIQYGRAYLGVKVDDDTFLIQIDDDTCACEAEA